ncbi:MAG: DUF547 domain-containing protein [Anaerolineales bacterium]
MDATYQGHGEKSIHPAEVFHPSNRMNAFIGIREHLLGLLVSSEPSNVLNPMPLSPSTELFPDLSVELKQAMDRLKGIAMDEPGRRVNYAELRASSEYKEYRQKCSALLREYQPEKLPTNSAKRAFWINLYNALLIDAVIAFDVQRSVIEGWLGIIAFFRRAAYQIDGKRVSLEDIEHGILRANRGHPFLPGPQFACGDPRVAWCLPLDPRIHFALNCGSRSCPPIQIYSADRLEAQLDQAGRNFVNANVKLDASKQMLMLSSIFQWYKGDFGSRCGVISFVIDHLPMDERRDWLVKYRGQIRLRYGPYDWGINSF